MAFAARYHLRFDPPSSRDSTLCYPASHIHARRSEHIRPRAGLSWGGSGSLRLATMLHRGRGGMVLRTRLSGWVPPRSLASTPANTSTACVVTHVLEAEPTIRIIVTACRLASSLRRVNEPTPGEPPSFLPVFDFWLSSLRTALDEDPFWGPNFWKELEPRASNLENGIHQMVRQCIEFEDMQATKAARQPELAPISASVGAAVRPAKLGRFRSEGKRTVFDSEEDSWMQKIVLGCWTTLLSDAANVGRTPGTAATLESKAVTPPLSRSLGS